METLTENQVEMINMLTQAMPYFRKEIGVSQTVLAEKVGMSRQMISLIERGRQPMTWTQFLAIVFFFKSNNSFNKKTGKNSKKNPNVVEQLLLVEENIRCCKTGGKSK